MAYPKACVIMSHQMGQAVSAASKRKAAAYASARFYENFGLVAKANQLRRQADKAFDDVKRDHLNRMEVNGCL